MKVLSIANKERKEKKRKVSVCDCSPTFQDPYQTAKKKRVGGFIGDGVYLPRVTRQRGKQEEQGKEGPSQVSLENEETDGA